MNNNYEMPSSTTWTIYTKSKCPYCSKIKIIMSDKTPQPKFINCDNYLINNKQSFLSHIQKIIGKEYKTFPIVFYKGEFVGGFTETFNFYYSEDNKNI